MTCLSDRTGTGTQVSKARDICCPTSKEQEAWLLLVSASSGRSKCPLSGQMPQWEGHPTPLENVSPALENHHQMPLRAGHIQSDLSLGLAHSRQQRARDNHRAQLATHLQVGEDHGLLPHPRPRCSPDPRQPGPMSSSLT